MNRTVLEGLEAKVLVPRAVLVKLRGIGAGESLGDGVAGNRPEDDTCNRVADCAGAEGPARRLSDPG